VLQNRNRLAVRVAVVAFTPADALLRYAERLGLAEVILLADPDRAAYRAFDFGRGSVARVWLDPRVWLRYASLLLRGRRLERSRGDTLQLGGDVLSDASGRIRWIYRSRGPEDRPTLTALQQAAERVTLSPRGT
jgi:hypothetical protein